MSVFFGQNSVLLPPSPTRPRIIFSRRNHRAWKRRRIKGINVRCLLNPTSSPFDDLFHSLISQISSVGSIEYVAPALGLVSGLALFFSSNSSKLLLNPNVENSSRDVGEWILFTSPTPFNRFVTLRCPSICFPGDGNVSEKLIKENRHYVELNTGRMIELVNVDDDVDADFEYQRICVGTRDGGVLSLDWPAALDMEEDTGLDTTVFIVPGTAEGSKEKSIKIFVSECLRRGTFPVVMNPRGCAGSPLTTARLFTAADSDDVFTAVHFINKKRPLSTLMGVGWGYGANMLTNHLADYGEKTPLTAASCIDSPFDLEEVTRYSYQKSYYQRLRDGLIKILENNKELFQGRGKGFNIERALSASSIRDFDQAISVVSFGVDRIEEFYAKCSTRDVIGKLKVPVLFIQNCHGKVSKFSVPRDVIAENPYTSLLLCALSPDEGVNDDQLSFSWCQHLTLEWLAAVELGLLKGRHPLLRDVDITISPSKGLPVSENRDSEKRGRVNKQLKLASRTSVIPPFDDVLPADSMTMKIQSKYENSTLESITSKEELQEKGSNEDDQSTSIDPVVQAARVVLNMLDVTVPDILSDEQKKKVLNAVGQGETLIQALQDAVPEEVRGKLTSAVSEILRSQGSDPKFPKILSLGDIPDAPFGRSFEVLQNKFKETIKHGNKEDNPSDNSGEVTAHGPDKPAKEVEFVEKQPEISMDSGNASQLSTTHDISGVSNFEKLNPNEMGKYVENEDSGTIADQKEIEKESGRYHIGALDVNDHSGENLPPGQQTDHNEDQSSAAPTSSEAEMVEDEAAKNMREEGGSMSNGDLPRFTVSQALDALTGLDDSTQVAVNSVFHVIEDMIDKLEIEDRENKVNTESRTSEIKRTVEVKESNSISFSHDAISKSGGNSRNTEGLHVQAGTQSDNYVLDDGVNTIYGCDNQRFSQFEGSSQNYFTNHKRSQLKSDDQIHFQQSAGGSPLNNSFETLLGDFKTQPHGDPAYKEYLNAYHYLKARNPMPVGTDGNPDLYLHYFPEEDKWKLLDQSEESSDRVSENGREEYVDGRNSKNNPWGRTTEPFNRAADSGKSLLQIAETMGVDIIPENFEFGSSDFDDFKILIKNVIFERLKAEVSRRISMAPMEELSFKLSKEIEYVANVVSMAALQQKGHIHKEESNQEQEIGILDGESITIVILASVQNTECLRRILPAGVLVGSILVELRNVIMSFNVSSLGSNDEKDSGLDEIKKSLVRPLVQNQKAQMMTPDETGTSETVMFNQNEGSDLAKSNVEEGYSSCCENSQNKEFMVGAVTAALGSSAFLAHHPSTGIDRNLNPTQEEKEDGQEPSKLGEGNERTQNNIVTNLAEKAMSVASPMVPMKEDGQLDQDRMVAMLTELGQKGGFLKLFGKVALLWGGIRGAMSLADKLILFLRIAERPLFQRIFSFTFMVILLWSPVILPLLPTLMQSWATNAPFKIAEFSCITGLYISIMIMITLWGKRIRKYEDPLVQYGLNFSSSEFQNFREGLIGGITLVILIHTVNSLIGCASFRWPTTLSSSTTRPVALVRSYACTILYIVQGLATATGASLVEELLFRSWLPQEIAADFGHHHGIAISGLMFALSQRSKLEIPGLWLLSLFLSGARERSHGSLSMAIGFRAGVVASNFILRTGGFIYYQPNFPLWVTGGQPFQPFSGVVGFAFSFILAIIFYPRQKYHHKKTNRVIRP